MPGVTDKWTDEEWDRFFSRLREEKIKFCEDNDLPIPDVFESVEDYCIPTLPKKREESLSIKQKISQRYESAVGIEKSILRDVLGLFDGFDVHVRRNEENAICISNLSIPVFTIKEDSWGDEWEVHACRINEVKIKYFMIYFKICDCQIPVTEVGNTLFFSESEAILEKNRRNTSVVRDIVQDL